jgi:dolichol-phosphate mannosyltransferase
VVVMDADLQHPPELLPRFVEQLQGGAALVVASRYVSGGTPGARPPLRAVISRSAEGLAKLFLPAARAVRDPVSGFFAFRRDAYEPLPPGYRGYKLLLFLLVMCEGKGVREVPLRFEPRTEGASKVTSGLAFVRLYLAELLLAGRLAARRRRPRGGPAPTALSTGG